MSCTVNPFVGHYIISLLTDELGFRALARRSSQHKGSANTGGICHNGDCYVIACLSVCTCDMGKWIQDAGNANTQLQIKASREKSNLLLEDTDSH